MPFNKYGKPCGSGRHENKFKYAYSDISKATGLRVSTLRGYKKLGKFNPYNLTSLVIFIHKYL